MFQQIPFSATSISNNPKTCIFCGQRPLTKEHIYGQWLKQLSLQASQKTDHMTSFVQPGIGRQQIKTMAKGKLHRNGAPYSHQLRVVCRSCNNGWLSQIQEQAKPVLTELVEGKWPKFDNVTMLNVSLYSTMVTMVLEFADMNTIATPAIERRQFFETKNPLSNWQVLIGLCDGTLDPGSMWHRAAILAESNSQVRTVPKPNAQTTTVCLGKCLIHTVSSPQPFLPAPDEYAILLGIRRIWPIPDREPALPVVFTQPGVDRVATEFFCRFGISRYPPFATIER